jgi:hypothetical protein
MTIAGYARRGADLVLQAFVVTLPFGNCPSDINGDGESTFEDLQLFLQWYGINDPRADWNGDGEVTFDDLQAFNAGLGC